MKNGQSEVTNRRDRLGLGQWEQRSEVVRVVRLDWWWRTWLRQTVGVARADGGTAVAAGGDARAQGEEAVLGADVAVWRS
jgi:hypothetical protein